MTWIKTCGTTNLDDALMSVEAGANALGFVFYEDSPRNVAPEVVREIVAKLPAKIETVGVFVNESFAFMEDVATRVGLSSIQLHYTKLDRDEFSRELRSPIKTYLSIPASSFSGQPLQFPADISAVFIDSGSVQQPGGTGQPFNWQEAASAAKAIAQAGFNIVVAGGLNSANVAEAIRILEPWGVDVVSGVESRPGKKDLDKVRAFIAAVRQTEKPK